MSLVSRITKAPIPYDAARGQDGVDLFDGIPDNAKNLIRGLAGCSPYLLSLLNKEGQWLTGNWDDTTESLQRAIRDDVTATTFDGLATDLRQAKRRIALLCAVADLGGVWSLSQTTYALTRFADFAVQYALEHLVSAEIGRGKLPGCTHDDPSKACGMFVLAMGKMGAFELNYSSDIDLIVLFDETQIDPELRDDVRLGFIRVTKRLCKLLSDVTSHGYVFRTDLRLRPDPSVTPVCLSAGAAERYYESLGRTWERAAFIKARCCAGDMEAGAAFLQVLRPFVWRKHLDFAAIEDAHDMRLRIREHKGLGGPITLPGHNMKLGRGGIREIEFFTQTRQIIAGGRDVDLQVRGTLDGLERLAEKGWISEISAKALSETYIDHRNLEHRLQMIGDAQTHDLPLSEPHFERLANFSGSKDVAVFKADVIASLEMVHHLTETFFAGDRGETNTAKSASLVGEVQHIVDRWPDLPALRSGRASEIFKRLQPVILARLNRASNPQEALLQFDGFLSGLPAGVQLFSLFEANPHLIDLLVDICATAPGLAGYMSKNAQVFDAVIGGQFFAPISSCQTLTLSLSAAIAAAGDYEAKLNAARRWMKEMRFRVGVLHLQGMITAPQAAHHYSDLAEACLNSLFEPICAEFATRFGPAPGKGVMVLGMGSLGAQSLTAVSDLDLIVIYDAGGEDVSKGKRPLPVTTYYARLTQALVTAISSPMSEGRLFEVDMRLRPSGRKGPVATAVQGFKSYQRTEAWTWEHLALTRARPICGAADLSSDIETFRRSLICGSHSEQKVLTDVKDMRDRLSAATPNTVTADPWAFKQGAGRMLDIELLAQAAALIAGETAQDTATQLSHCVALGWCSAAKVQHLVDAYKQLQSIQQVVRLVASDSFEPAKIGQGAREFLLRETGAASIEILQAEVMAAQKTTAALIKQILSR